VRYFAGIDAGGTKTHCLVADEEGRVLGFGRGGTGNYESFGVPAARIEIERALNEALAEAGVAKEALSGAGLGIAGADVPEDYVMLERELFTPLFGAVPYALRNDSMGGLRGGTMNPDGVVIACGTGCVCAGRNARGEETRAGGISEHFGDQVSGSSIGERGLHVVWRYRDGIAPPTLMTDMFLERSGQPDLDAFFYAMYREELTFADLQPMAKIVADAAYAGDAQACDILEWAGTYLGDMVTAVARHLAMTRESFDVVMAGSVFKGRSPVLRDAMAARIHRTCPEARLVMPIYEPVVGALLLGLEMEVTMTAPAYELLGESLEALGRKHGLSFKSE